MRTGQVIGSTDAQAGEVKDRPVHFQHVLATLYQRMGIDVNEVRVTDRLNRPHFLVDDNRQPLAELV